MELFLVATRRLWFVLLLWFRVVVGSEEAASATGSSSSSLQNLSPSKAPSTDVTLFWILSACVMVLAIVLQMLQQRSQTLSSDGCPSDHYHKTKKEGMSISTSSVNGSVPAPPSRGAPTTNLRLRMSGSKRMTNLAIPVMVISAIVASLTQVSISLQSLSSQATDFGFRIEQQVLALNHQQQGGTTTKSAESSSSSSRRLVPPQDQPPWRILPSASVVPQQFVLDRLDVWYQDYGMRVMASSSENASSASASDLAALLKDTLCKGGAPTKPKDEKYCHESVSYLRCMSCGTKQISGKASISSWYAIQSQAGALFAQIDEQSHRFVTISPASPLPPSLNNNQENINVFSYSHFTELNILVPVKGSSAKMKRLAKSLASAIEDLQACPYGSHITTVKLIATFYADEPRIMGYKKIGDYHANVASLASTKIDVEWISCGDTDASKKQAFHRAQATNCLLEKACQRNDCIVNLIDVDMTFRNPSYFLHTLTYVWPHSSAYFPIVFSKFNPATVELVAKLAMKHSPIENLIRHHKEIHDGMWRTTGFGMWAMSGVDAARFRMNAFEGWGGEDVDFFRIVSQQLHVIRTKEAALEHEWHDKNCTKGVTVFDDKMQQDCQNSRLKAEGLSLGVFLKMHELHRQQKQPQGYFNPHHPSNTARLQQAQQPQRKVNPLATTQRRAALIE